MDHSFTIPRVPGAAIPRTGVLRAGAARGDITPALGLTLSGFGSFHSQAARASWGRLFATVLALDDGAGERVALVSLDLHAGTRYLAELVANAVAAETGIGIDRLFFAGIHTHSGPGHVYGNTLYDGMTAKGRGLDRVTGEWLAAGIAGAVREAVRSLHPARVGHGVSRRWGYSVNRSLPAFVNDGASPEQFARAVAGRTPIPSGIPEENLALDPRLQVIWAEDLDGLPIGAFATFAAHGATLGARHATLSSDWFGCAVRAAQDRIFRDDTYWKNGTVDRASRRRVPLALALGAAGDVDPSLPGCEAAEIVSKQGIDLAREVGEALGETLSLACREARGKCTDTLAIRTRFIDAEPAGAVLDDGRRLSHHHAFGAPAAGGSELGRNIILDANNLHTAVDVEGKRGHFDGQSAHAPKLTVASELVELVTGRPAAVLPLRLVMLDSAAFRWWLCGIPGEPTTMQSYRTERMLRDRGATSVMVAGVCGDYTSYFTTPKEYERQHYEGACTVWGRAAGDWLIDRFRDLARGKSPPLSPEAVFEQDAVYETTASYPGAATRPTLEVDDGGELVGTWESDTSVLPNFGPDAWVVIESLDPGGQFVPVVHEGAVVSDQTREILIERHLHRERAIWTFRYPLPPALRGRMLRAVLQPADFEIPDGESASVGVYVPVG